MTRATSLLAGVVLVGTCAALALADPPVSDLPDPARTPGAVYTTDAAVICARVGGLTYEKRSRAGLTGRMKRDITAAYGQVPGDDGDHELDHRVPAALAGRSDATNVWWEPGRGHGTDWDYHVKDHLDDWAWRQVCVTRTLTPEEGQAIFLEPDWRGQYCRYVGGAPCPPR